VKNVHKLAFVNGKIKLPSDDNAATAAAVPTSGTDAILGLPYQASGSSVSSSTDPAGTAPVKKKRAPRKKPQTADSNTGESPPKPKRSRKPKAPSIPSATATDSLATGDNSNSSEYRHQPSPLEGYPVVVKQEDPSSIYQPQQHMGDLPQQPNVVVYKGAPGTDQAYLHQQYFSSGPNSSAGASVPGTAPEGDPSAPGYGYVSYIKVQDVGYNIVKMETNEQSGSDPSSGQVVMVPSENSGSYEQQQQQYVGAREANNGSQDASGVQYSTLYPPAGGNYPSSGQQQQHYWVTGGISSESQPSHGSPYSNSGSPAAGQYGSPHPVPVSSPDNNGTSGGNTGAGTYGAQGGAQTGQPAEGQHPPQQGNYFYKDLSQFDLSQFYM